MSAPIAVVEIIGAPVACADGVKNSWQEMANWVVGKLQTRYGTAVTTTYYDLFDPNCPAVPPESQLPLVRINGDIVSSGGKLSLPRIHQHLQGMGIQSQKQKSSSCTKETS